MPFALDEYNLFEHAFPDGTERKANPGFQKAAKEFNTNTMPFYSHVSLNYSSSILANVVLILDEMNLSLRNLIFKFYL